VIRTASFSEDHRYRYLLTRQWNQCLPMLPWLMLNPSTADSQKDDPTIRRCMDFSVAWNYGGIVVLNLFAFRSSHPAKLIAVADPVAHSRGVNDLTIIETVAKHGQVVCAWGSHSGKVRALIAPRVKLILESLAYARMGKPDWPMFCVGTNADGQPQHPLWAPKLDKPIEWRSPE
jgi:hypothetical protein